MIRYLLIALVAAGLLALAVRHFLAANPADLARQLRRLAGLGLVAGALGLVVLRQPALALPVGMAGLALLRRRGWSGGTTPGGRSGVKSARLDMTLDHDSGEMDGTVLAGRYEGRRLSELTLDELLAFAGELAGDPQSLRLLEAYLDRAHPAWREHVEADEAAGARAPPGTGEMSAHEAHQVLGLEPGAGEAEIRDAHRRLMKQVHPDRGGSAALAAKVNEAKDRLLREHR
ncbi:DnaJ domain-containing protein [Propylenella binzhouense]|uniref:DnaJ domain-containing protein n=1 Tax=Propylenella binzhouense TaxID=2555902 RepID=UPI0031B615E1